MEINYYFVDSKLHFKDLKVVFVLKGDAKLPLQVSTRTNMLWLDRNLSPKIFVSYDQSFALLKTALPMALPPPYRAGG